MRLPDELEQRLQHDTHRLEAEQAMPYVSSFERRATEQGLQQGLQQAHQTVLRMLSHVLAHRFGPLPQSIITKLDKLSTEQLERLADNALTAKSLDEFVDQLPLLDTSTSPSSAA
jgi:hypothetical protein